MAKSKRNQINKKNKQTYAELVQLMKDIDQKYSIKVGIIGEDASAKHPDSDLTNAELGAIHEFGATINVTEKMRAFLHHIGIHLKPETTTIVIPTRSFLRMPLLSGDFKEFIYSNAKLPITGFRDLSKTGEQSSKEEAIELNKLVAEMQLEKDAGIVKSLAEWIAVKALERVHDAFESGGFGKWAPISAVTKANRKGAKDNMPLIDTGEMRNSISAVVRRVK